MRRVTSHHVIINRVLAARGEQVNSNDTSGNKLTPQEAVDYRYRGQTFVFFPSLGDDAMKQWSDIMLVTLGMGGRVGAGARETM